MATITRPASSGAINMADASKVVFDAFVTRTANEVSWTTPDGSTVTLNGTFGNLGGIPTGTVDSFSIVLAGPNTDVDLTFEFTSPKDIAEFLDTVERFWNAALSEDNVFNVASTQSFLISGDGYDETLSTTGTDDEFTMTGQYAVLAGDFHETSGTVLGGNDAFNFATTTAGAVNSATGDIRGVLGGVATGGADTFTDNSTFLGIDISIIGDFLTHVNGATGHGGDDTINGGINVMTAVGDVSTLNGTLFAGDDDITGGNADDLLIGDVETVGSTALVSFGDDTISGGGGNDTIYGDFETDHSGGGFLTGHDILSGDAGDDTIFGQSGNDELRGGTGTDELYGGDGMDRLFAEAGEDASGTEVYDGGEGYDTLVASGGNGDVQHDLSGAIVDSISEIVFDTLAGTGTRSLILQAEDFTFGTQITSDVSGQNVSGDREVLTFLVDADTIELDLSAMNFTDWGGQNDLVRVETSDDEDFTVTGSDQNDEIIGSGGEETFNGGEGDDILDGRGNTDILSGGEGDDTYRADDEDILTELAGEGTDTVEIATSYTLAQFFENLELTCSADVNGTGNDSDNELTGNSGRNTLSGGGGNDDLFGNAGDDILRGGNSDDSLSGDAGRDKLFGDGGKDSLNGGSGVDVLNGGSGNDTLFGGAGNGRDTLLGGAGRDDLDGGKGNDSLAGGAGNDKLVGGAGNDRLAMGKGQKDVVTGGGGKDVFDFNKSEGRKNKVTDFKNGQDKIDLRGFDFKNKAKALKEFTDAGGRNNDKIVFNDSGTKVVIKGIDLKQLNGADVLI